MVLLQHQPLPQLLFDRGNKNVKTVNTKNV